MANRKRDSQRSKVYDAIRAANSAVGKPLADMREVNALVSKVQNRATLQRRYGPMLNDINVGDGRGSRWTHGDHRGIVVPTCQRTDIYVMRAIAYTLLERHRRGRVGGERYKELRGYDSPWHGWQYCAILMDLVRFVCGETQADALKAEFEKKNVRWTKPTQKALTDDQKQELKARGLALAALNRDRKRREEYTKINPEAILKNPDEFEDPHWETLYRVWR